MKFLKLVNFELGRFMKIYVALAAITVISQFTGVIVKSKEYLEQADTIMLEQSINIGTYVQNYSAMTMKQVTQSLWFMGPIALSAAALIFYCFFIWYRDWLGKNTFIYRLLMLPTARLNILLAKAAAIFLMVLGLISLQIVLLPVESTLLQWMVPTDLRMDMNTHAIIESFFLLRIIIPDTFTGFLVAYGIGFMAVFILFVAVLLERSFRLKGVLLGAGYAILAGLCFLAPLILHIIPETRWLYPGELFAVEIVLLMLVTGVSIWLGNFLLKKKVTV
ncbi:hypothetical protein ACFOGI_15650 [Virgibacillus xinjiangensis]|uniref:ABC-2 family transporter protein n=1 Tax=Virgibacillus xinjiangensis TaxID=393090 RepID=A0ABV7CZ66_9BACI